MFWLAIAAIAASPPTEKARGAEAKRTYAALFAGPLAPDTARCQSAEPGKPKGAAIFIRIFQFGPVPPPETTMSITTLYLDGSPVATNTTRYLAEPSVQFQLDVERSEPSPVGHREWVSVSIASGTKAAGNLSTEWVCEANPAPPPP